MLRHKGFESVKDLKLFLSEAVPSDVYHSSAYYENPEADMDKKGWLGADLVFDIDADHIPTSCNKKHDEWTCKGCGLRGKGIAPENCSKCGGQKFETKTWSCELCLNSAKEETIKLFDILEDDFGFSNKEIHVFFSGHRGYHIHVENDAIKTLGAMARKEIVDYVSGLGLSIPGRERKSPKTKIKSKHFFLHDFAWNKRLKHGIRNFIRTATKEDLRNTGLRKVTIDIILSNKELILRRCIDEGFWDSFKGIDDKKWKKIAKYVKDGQSAKIDTVVTTDIHRLIRLNGTLHGK
ncbi:MAG: hypothetical protein JSW44_01650, partial [Candidatus Bathyarchaeota archaeon]